MLNESNEIIEMIDELLKTNHRPTSYDTNMIISGSVGNRVYGSFEMQPGLCGNFHFVHHSNIKDILELDFRDLVYPIKLKTTYEWKPSHLFMIHTYPCFEIEEKKFITEEDFIVSQIKIKSLSGKIKFSLGLKSSVLNEKYEASIDLFEQKIHLKAFSSDPTLFTTRKIVLEEQEQFTFTIACGFKVEGEEWSKSIPELAEHKLAFGQFFNGIPILASSDKDLEKIYYYHWFLLRHHISRPALGNICYPIVYEGRHGYFQESSGGECIEWEFSRGILLSTQLHLLDLRWQQDHELLKGIILNFTNHIGKMQPFLGYNYELPLLPGCIRIHDFTGHYFFHMLPYITWQIYELTNDQDWLEKVTPALWQDLDNWSFYDRENSGLPIMVYEGDGAGEFGPAAHYHKKGSSSLHRLGVEKNLEIGLPCSVESSKAKWGPPITNRRTEVATYYGLNHYGFSKIFSILGDEKRANVCLEKYYQIKHAIGNFMWDEDEGFFMELLEDFQKIEEVKQIGGIYILLLMDPINKEKYLQNIMQPERFNLKYGLPSVSKDSFAFSPNNTVDGIRPHTCLWNGPTWPYATSLSLLGIGRLIKNIEADSLKKKFSDCFKEELDKYIKLHYLYGDQQRPCLIEHYNCETGMPLSEQDDYNHSCFIDIIIRMVCGMDMDDDGNLDFSPINLGFEDIKLENIMFKGQKYSVEIAKSEAYLYCEGKLIRNLHLKDEF